jgi:hypothetical protein
VPKRREKGEGSIYWSESRQQFVGSFELTAATGKRRRKRVSGETRKEVADKIREARSEGAPGSGLKLGTFLDDWLASSAVTGLRQATRESYADTLRLHVRPYLAETPLRSLTPARSMTGSRRCTGRRSRRRRSGTPRSCSGSPSSAPSAAGCCREPGERAPGEGRHQARPDRADLQPGRRCSSTRRPWMRVAILLAQSWAYAAGKSAGCSGTISTGASASCRSSARSRPSLGRANRRRRRASAWCSCRRSSCGPWRAIGAGWRLPRARHVSASRGGCSRLTTAAQAPAQLPAGLRDGQNRGRAGLLPVPRSPAYLRHGADLTLGHDAKSVSQLLGHADVERRWRCTTIPTQPCSGRAPRACSGGSLRRVYPQIRPRANRGPIAAGTCGVLPSYLDDREGATMRNG